MQSLSQAAGHNAMLYGTQRRSVSDEVRILVPQSPRSSARPEIGLACHAHRDRSAYRTPLKARLTSGTRQTNPHSLRPAASCK